MPAVVLIPLVGLAVGMGWTARGGRRSTPGVALALVSLVATIAVLSSVGGAA
jgi:hypothetical protein